MRKPTLYQSLKAKKRSQSLIIAVTSYTDEEAWAQVKATAVDPECFEDSFVKWKAAALAARRQFLRSGVRALECMIVPEDFFAWCKANDCVNDAAARADFASVTLSAAFNQAPPEPAKDAG